MKVSVSSLNCKRKGSELFVCHVCFAGASGRLSPLSGTEILEFTYLHNFVSRWGYFGTLLGECTLKYPIAEK